MSDIILKQDIIDELDFEPSIDATHVAVSVDQGTVTLSGYVRSFAEKCTVEAMVKRMKGVQAIAQEIEVRPVGAHLTADDEIARRAADMLRWHATVPREAIQVKVEDGWITLTGKVHWNFERSAAESSMRNLLGVRGVLNQIKIIPAPTVADVRQRILNALKRDAEVEAEQITVQVADHKVTLEGKVRTWAERDAAERAVWSAAGVTSLVDHIKVEA